MTPFNFRFTLAIILVLTCGLLAGPGTVLATTEDLSTGYFAGQVDLGYRSVSSEDEFVRALEYSDKHSGPTGKLIISGGEGQSRFYLQGHYLDAREYRGDFSLDSHGLLRLELASESMVHNLEHIPYADRQAPPDDVPPGQNGYISFEDQNPGDRYQLEVNQSSAHVRLKPPSYPAHLNLGYWRQEKDGNRQLRFTDEGHGRIPGQTDAYNCRKCHMESKTRDIEWVTDQFTAEVDAHVGPVDIIVEQLYREFRDHNAIPTDLFGSHNYRDLVNGVGVPTEHQHDEAPDSRLTKTTLKLHTSLAGGLVGAGAFSIGSMENQSKLTEVRPTKSKTDFYQLAGDVTYIINPQWTTNFRYRMTDLDNSNPATLTADGTSTTDPAVAVRDNVDVTRSSYEGTVSYRPNRKYTIYGEYRYLEIDRGNTGSPTPYSIDTTTGLAHPDLVWDLPAQENIHRFKLGLRARPLGVRRLRLKGHYIFETSEDPAYGTSFEDRQEVYAGATWTPSRRWGLQASARYNSEQNDGQKTELFNTDNLMVNYPRSRDRAVTNLLGSLWTMPCERINISASYSFQATDISEDLIFGSEPSGSTAGYSIFADNVDYRQRVHSANVLVDWRIIETLRATAEGRYIRSTAYFDPRFPTQQFAYGSTPDLIDISSAGLKQISQLNIIQSGLSLGLDWSPLPAWTGSVNYSFDDYEDRNSDLFDGSAQTYMVSLGHSW